MQMFYLFQHKNKKKKGKIAQNSRDFVAGWLCAWPRVTHPCRTHITQKRHAVITSSPEAAPGDVRRQQGPDRGQADEH